jgi:NADPH:quinone reductase-like Zn-dependent oxidoreductase
VGTFAVQLAKYFGAEVTAVDSSDKHELLQRLGANHVIDFTREDFTRNGKRYDLIVDVVSNRSLSSYKQALKPGGKFVMIGGTMRAIFAAMAFRKLMSAGSDKKIEMLGYKANKDLDYLASLIENHVIVSVIERKFSLRDTAEAFREYGTGRTRGKVIITV